MSAAETLIAGQTTEEAVSHYVQCGRDCCEPCDRVHDAIIAGERMRGSTEEVSEALERLSRKTCEATDAAR